MPMTDAFAFLSVCKTDTVFRDRAYCCADASEFRTYIANSGFHFLDSELDDAIRSLELKSRDEFEAAEVRELGQWYRMMALTAPPSPCASCRGKRA